MVDLQGKPEKEISKAIVVYENGSTQEVYHGMIVNTDDTKPTGNGTEEVTCHFMQSSRLDLITITGAMIICCEKMGLTTELMAYLQGEGGDEIGS